LPDLHSFSDMRMTNCSKRENKPAGNASGQHWSGIDQIDCLGAVMQEEHLTADQCDELAKALREDAARLPHGSDRENLLQLAADYNLLADMKRMVLRKVN
jgi:hypothetical protein